ncbi:MAG: T9SS type A sorting domain-containing protein [Ignavibacteria bacterium]|nr:T9SS type A sorting domain-containing protein [Ignavibacteria bacterium]
MVENCELAVSEMDTFTTVPVVQDLQSKIQAFYQNYGTMPPQPPPFPTTIDPVSQIPKTYNLYQNYPNPFNPTTTIKYDLPKPDNTKLIIYNILGQRVATLVNENQNAGYYKVVWDGKADRGYQVASGIYFYMLTTGDYKKVKKMVFLR